MSDVNSLQQTLCATQCRAKDLVRHHERCLTRITLEQGHSRTCMVASYLLTRSALHLLNYAMQALGANPVYMQVHTRNRVDRIYQKALSCTPAECSGAARELLTVSGVIDACLAQYMNPSLVPGAHLRQVDLPDTVRAAKDRYDRLHQQQPGALYSDTSSLLQKTLDASAGILIGQVSFALSPLEHLHFFAPFSAGSLELLRLEATRREEWTTLELLKAGQHETEDAANKWWTEHLALDTAESRQGLLLAAQPLVYLAETLLIRLTQSQAV